jgi:hypothetical protein
MCLAPAISIQARLVGQHSPSDASGTQLPPSDASGTAFRLRAMMSLFDGLTLVLGWENGFHHLVFFSTPLYRTDQENPVVETIFP